MDHTQRLAVSRRVLFFFAGAAACTAFPRYSAGAVVDFTVVGKDGWLFAVFDDVRHSDLTQMRKVTRTINDAIALLKRAGIETALVLTPAKARIYREFLPLDFQFTPDGDRRYAAALDMLRAPGTLVPDLSATLLGQRKSHPDEPLFLKADSHWTAAGGEAVASDVARDIKGRFKLPPSAAPGTQLGGLVTVRQGRNDLADAFPDAVASKYPPETFKMHQVQQSGGGVASLIEDDSADVVVVGNSFMQPKYGFAAMLSNQIQRPVSLAWKVHQASPYRTLLSTLAAEKSRRRRPNLLVWNFEETDMLATTDQGGAWGPNVMAAQAFLSDLKTTLGA